MGRPPDAIRAQLLGDRYRISYVEEGRWHMTPEIDRAKALAWARRNKGKFLDAASKLELQPFLQGFFEADSEWSKDMAAKKHFIGDKTRTDYRSMVRNYIQPLFGSSDPRAITAKEIGVAIRDVKTASGRELASATKYRLMHVMTLIMQDLAERKLIDSNPLIGVQPYSKAPENPRGALPRSVLTKLFPQVHGALMRIWSKTFWVACMCVIYDSGMRPVEVRGLRWADIRPKEEAAIVRRPKRGRRGRDGTPVGVVRAVRLSPRTIQELAIWKAETAYSKPEDLVFTFDGTTAVTDAGIVAAFRAGLRSVGEFREEWTTYWLRHSFVTYAMADLTVEEVAQLAGHSVAVAEGTYSHPDDEVILKKTKAARDKLSKTRS